MSNTPLKKKKRQRKSTKSSQTSSSRKKLVYEVETLKKGRKYSWQVLEHLGSNTRVVQTCDIKEQAQDFADFHNKNQIWLVNGGIPSFLLTK